MFLLAWALAFALAQDAPTLHQRADAPPELGLEAVEATGHIDLPPEAEGVYPWNDRGSRITLFFEENTLRGYMSEVEDGAAVTFPFATTHADGASLSWTTRTIHGRMYSFEGKLVRGTAAAPSLPGYYLLIGTLMRSPGRPMPLRAARRPGVL